MEWRLEKEAGTTLETVGVFQERCELQRKVPAVGCWIL